MNECHKQCIQNFYLLQKDRDNLWKELFECREQHGRDKSRYTDLSISYEHLKTNYEAQSRLLERLNKPLEASVYQENKLLIKEIEALKNKLSHANTLGRKQDTDFIQSVRDIIDDYDYGEDDND